MCGPLSIGFLASFSSLVLLYVILLHTYKKKRLANKETITYFLLIACHVGDLHLLDFYLVTWDQLKPREDEAKKNRLSSFNEHKVRS
jgi:hypothetical protein